MLHDIATIDLVRDCPISCTLCHLLLCLAFFSFTGAYGHSFGRLLQRPEERPSLDIDDLHIVSPDDMSLAAFDKHRQPAGPHLGHDKNSFPAYRLLFGPPGSTANLDLGDAPLQFWKTISPLVAGVHICNVSTGHRNGSTWMLLLFAKHSKPAGRVLPQEPPVASRETATTLSPWVCFYRFGRPPVLRF